MIFPHQKKKRRLGCFFLPPPPIAEDLSFSRYDYIIHNNFKKEKKKSPRETNFGRNVTRRAFLYIYIPFIQALCHVSFWFVVGFFFLFSTCLSLSTAGCVSRERGDFLHEEYFLTSKYLREVCMSPLSLSLKAPHGA